MIRDAVIGVANSALLRTLFDDPDGDLAEARKAVFEDVQGERSDHDHVAVSDSELATHVGSGLVEFSKMLHRRAVLNPLWLEKQGIRFRFFLANADPGWLRRLQEELDRTLRPDVSRFTLYGDQDTLISFAGTDDDVTATLASMEAVGDAPVNNMTAISVAMYNGYVPTVPTSNRLDAVNCGAGSNAAPCDSSVLNGLVDDYDSSILQFAKGRLLEAGVILGPTWTLETESSPLLRAVIGVRTHGGVHAVSASEVLEVLRTHDVIRRSLRSFYEVDRDFRYLAEVCCQDLDELDKITDIVSNVRIGPIRFEGTTRVIASGLATVPRFVQAGGAEGPVVERRAKSEVLINDIQEYLQQLPIDTVDQLTGLSRGVRQAFMLASIELDEQLANQGWDTERKRKLDAIVVSFRGIVLSGSLEFASPVNGMSTAVEEYLKVAFDTLVRVVFEGNKKTAQDELGLANRDIARNTMGNLINSLKKCSTHDKVKFLHDQLGQDQIRRLEEFHNQRNLWTHGSEAKSSTAATQVVRAKDRLVDGIELMRWIGAGLIEAIDSSDNAGTAPGGHELDFTGEIGVGVGLGARIPRVFISHSSSDGATAQVIHNYLVGAFGNRDDEDVFVDKLSIPPGGSIVDHISRNLAGTDVLVVLLSSQSVTSRWVQREVAAGLYRQLTDNNIRIIPIVLDDCEIPPLLRVVKHIDARENLDRAMLELLMTVVRDWIRPKKD